MDALLPGGPATGVPGSAGNVCADGVPHGGGDAAPGRRAGEPSSARRWPGWLPAISLTVLVGVVLERHGVSASDMGRFGVYLVLGLTLPGLLVLRALHPGRRTLTEEIALGTALGYAIEVIVYIVCRAAGLPLLVAAWPVGTYVLFLAVPRLRAHWRGGPRPRTPVWWSWSMAGICAYVVALPTSAFFARYDVTRPGLWAGSADMPFHLSLVGELRHHMPPTTPAVAGEPLFYHWFVYAHFASASWLTGLEPVVLLFRLGMLPMLAALLVLIGVTGRRVTGSWTGGALSAAGMVALKAPNPYQGFNWIFTYGGVQDTGWASPTQTFGALLFAPVVLLVLDLLGRGRRGAGGWVLLGGLLIAVMGAKAVYLPLLGAGVAAVTAARLLRRRRVSRPAAVLGMTAGCLIFAQLVLFGGAKLGMVVDPFSFVRMGWRWLSAAGPPSESSVLGIALLYVIGWAVAWSGMLGLLSRPRLFARSPVLLMLGIGAGGLGVAFLFGHPGFSQLFFLMGAVPYLTIAAVCGLMALLRRVRSSALSVWSAAAAGTVAALALPALGGIEIPLRRDQPDTVLYPPYLAFLVAAAVLLAVLTAVMGGRRACAVSVVVFMTLGLAGNVRDRVAQPRARTKGVVTIPDGALTALRWLRAHSHPDDVVATNAHCDWTRRRPCESGRFWVTAFSERRVLIEGWAYTPTNLANWKSGKSLLEEEFWDRRRSDANREAFREPSAHAVARLGERYGVDWLFVDESLMEPYARLGDFAELRFRSGDHSLYAVPRGGG